MLNPSTDPEYSGKVNAPDAEYPNGSSRDATVENDPAATPLLARKFNDDWGFDAALLSAAGLTPSGDPDTALASQRLQALAAISGRAFATVALLQAGAGVDTALLDGVDVSAETRGYYGGWAAMVEPQGNAEYILTTRQRVREAKGDPAWEPDGWGDHYLFGGTDYVATLQTDGQVNLLKYGMSTTLGDNVAPFNAANVEHVDLLIPSSSDEYLFSGPLELKLGTTLTGEGYQPASDKYTSLRFSAAATRGVVLEGACHLENILLNGASTTNCIGLTIPDSGVNNISATRVRVQDFTGANANGIKITDAVGVFFDQVFSLRNKVNMTIQGISGPFPTYMHFKDCAFREGDIGVLIARAYGVCFDGCLFEQNVLEGCLIDVLDVVERVEFTNQCWFERNNDGNPAGYQLRADGSGGGEVLEYITVQKCFFHQGTAKAANFSRAVATTFRENVINNRAGEVLFDTNSSGWIEDQRFGVKEGVIVDSSGFMKDLSDLTYIEGVWTATEVSNLNFTGAVFSEGKYIRIGNQVTLTGKWDGNVTAASANTAVQFDGLPFPQETNVSTEVGTCALTGSNFAAGTVFDATGGDPNRFFAGLAGALVAAAGAQSLTFSITYTTIE